MPANFRAVAVCSGIASGWYGIQCFMTSTWYGRCLPGSLRLHTVLTPLWHGTVVSCGMVSSLNVYVFYSLFILNTIQHFHRIFNTSDGSMMRVMHSDRVMISNMLANCVYPFAGSVPTKGPAFACAAPCRLPQHSHPLKPPLEYYELKDN